MEKQEEVSDFMKLMLSRLESNPQELASLVKMIPKVGGKSVLTPHEEHLLFEAKRKIANSKAHEKLMKHILDPKPKKKRQRWSYAQGRYI